MDFGPSIRDQIPCGVIGRQIFLEQNELIWNRKRIRNLKKSIWRGSGPHFGSFFYLWPITPQGFWSRDTRAVHKILCTSQLTGSNVSVTVTRAFEIRVLEPWFYLIHIKFIWVINSCMGYQSIHGIYEIRESPNRWTLYVSESFHCGRNWIY